MKVYEGIEMIQLKVAAFGSSAVLNPTVIWDEESAILVDTGMPGEWTNIHNTMVSAGIEPDLLQGVILTHQDIDHIGSVQELIKELKIVIEVWAHELDKPYIEGTFPLIKTDTSKMSKEMLQSMPDEARQLFENPPKTKVTKTLANGDFLPYCGGITVIFTPGHTAGHISLYAHKSKTLIAGDAMICIDGNLHAPVKQTTLDMDTALQSIGKFLEYDIERVICYHGGICTENVKEQLQNLVHQHQVSSAQ
ncbi:MULTISPECIES: MBL fold metallo-hydrolase [unclassified Bacillus (in: firmicutes)]|uniref:MBL fold metallo-hydrolase n=1 Tax=unclassified Bacillus (in: firmicutes) TaxID=185979 RepID=UPI0008ECF101|nr:MULTISPECIES: MBL fold metallo-hydrolase [unclassified Bacillus (in: firmicutes)]SFB18074.1 Glyoxylase, beta-lactamase superfamily II [Bacillus sp. UNCCL13]SFQ76383.1 Glyoxylase, beta-lactamase superfamily II [Bacillus sp. cl95]